MPTQFESPAAVSGTSSKTLQLLRKKLRQLLRITLVLTICLAVAAGALAIWWLNSLNGLPDIGDPFDLAAYRAFRVPDDQNAFVLLRRADGLVTPRPDLPRAVDVSFPTVSWSKADPKLQAWVEANRQAIELFQQAAAIPDAADPVGDPSTDVRGLQLSELVLLEGSKRQESGDAAGAWDCYRAVLRMAVHIQGRGSLDQRNASNIILLARLAAETARALGGRLANNDSPA